MGNKIVLIGLVGVIIITILIFIFTSQIKTKSSFPYSKSEVQPFITSKKNQTNPPRINQKDERIVFLKASGFDPQKITVKKGTKVKWINQSGSVATINSNNHPTHLLYPPLNLGQFTNGQSLEFVFTSQGAYAYHNHLNPKKTGEVIVE